MVVIGAGISMRHRATVTRIHFMSSRMTGGRDNVESAGCCTEESQHSNRSWANPICASTSSRIQWAGLVANITRCMVIVMFSIQSGPKPDWAGARNLGKLIMMGTPNAGSMDAFRSLLQGYSITETSHPHIALLSPLNRDSISTYPSATSCCRAMRGRHFLDEQLAQSISICSILKRGAATNGQQLSMCNSVKASRKLC